MKLIRLTHGKACLVDDEDYEWLTKITWHARRHRRTGWEVCHTDSTKGGRVARKHRTIRMHRLILDAPKGMIVDHINHNPLDNRRANLRLCTRSQNEGNQLIKTKRGTSRFKGVHLRADRAKWRATITHTINGRQRTIYLGSFETEEEAALAYNEAAVAYFGEFASLNVV